jgi:hypothetical protein
MKIIPTNYTIFIYWLVLIVCAIISFETVNQQVGEFHKMIKRKFFHALVILVFLPGLYFIVLISFM